MGVWRDLAAEHTAMELLEAEDRIVDLQTEGAVVGAERDHYRDLAENYRTMTQTLLGALHLMTLKFKRKRRRRLKLEGRRS